MTVPGSILDPEPELEASSVVECEEEQEEQEEEAVEGRSVQSIDMIPLPMEAAAYTIGDINFRDMVTKIRETLAEIKLNMTTIQTTVISYDNLSQDGANVTIADVISADLELHPDPDLCPVMLIAPPALPPPPSSSSSSQDAALQNEADELSGEAEATADAVFDVTHEELEKDDPEGAMEGTDETQAPPDDDVNGENRSLGADVSVVEELTVAQAEDTIDAVAEEPQMLLKAASLDDEEVALPEDDVIPGGKKTRKSPEPGAVAAEGFEAQQKPEEKEHDIEQQQQQQQQPPPSDETPDGERAAAAAAAGESEASVGDEEATLCNMILRATVTVVEPMNEGSNKESGSGPEQFNVLNKAKLEETNIIQMMAMMIIKIAEMQAYMDLLSINTLETIVDRSQGSIEACQADSVRMTEEFFVRQEDATAVQSLIEDVTQVEDEKHITDIQVKEDISVQREDPNEVQTLIEDATQVEDEIHITDVQVKKEISVQREDVTDHKFLQEDETRVEDETQPKDDVEVKRKSSSEDPRPPHTDELSDVGWSQSADARDETMEPDHPVRKRKMSIAETEVVKLEESIVSMHSKIQLEMLRTQYNLLGLKKAIKSVSEQAVMVEAHLTAAIATGTYAPITQGNRVGVQAPTMKVEELVLAEDAAVVIPGDSSGTDTQTGVSKAKVDSSRMTPEERSNRKRTAEFAKSPDPVLTLEIVPDGSTGVAPAPFLCTDELAHALAKSEVGSLANKSVNSNMKIINGSKADVGTKKLPHGVQEEPFVTSPINKDPVVAVEDDDNDDEKDTGVVSAVKEVNVGQESFMDETLKETLKPTYSSDISDVGIEPKQIIEIIAAVLPDVEVLEQIKPATTFDDSDLTYEDSELATCTSLDTNSSETSKNLADGALVSTRSGDRVLERPPSPEQTRLVEEEIAAVMQKTPLWTASAEDRDTGEMRGTADATQKTEPSEGEYATLEEDTHLKIMPEQPAAPPEGQVEMVSNKVSSGDENQEKSAEAQVDVAASIGDLESVQQQQPQQQSEPPKDIDETTSKGRKPSDVFEVKEDSASAEVWLDAGVSVGDTGSEQQQPHHGHRQQQQGDEPPQYIILTKAKDEKQRDVVEVEKKIATEKEKYDAIKVEKTIAKGEEYDSIGVEQARARAQEESDVIEVEMAKAEGEEESDVSEVDVDKKQLDVVEDKQKTTRGKEESNMIKLEKTIAKDKEESHGVEVEKMVAEDKEECNVIEVEKAIAKDEEDSDWVEVENMISKADKESDVIKVEQTIAKEEEEFEWMEVEKTIAKDEVESDVMEVGKMTAKVAEKSDGLEGEKMIAKAEEESDVIKVEKNIAKAKEACEVIKVEKTIAEDEEEYHGVGVGKMEAKTEEESNVIEVEQTIAKVEEKSDVIKEEMTIAKEESDVIKDQKMTAKAKAVSHVIAVEKSITKDERESYGVEVEKMTLKERKVSVVIEVGKTKAKDEECDVSQFEQTIAKDEKESDGVEVIKMMSKAEKEYVVIEDEKTAAEDEEESDGMEVEKMGGKTEEQSDVIEVENTISKAKEESEVNKDESTIAKDREECDVIKVAKKISKYEESDGVEVEKMITKDEGESDIIEVEEMTAKDEEELDGVEVEKTIAKDEKESIVIKVQMAIAKDEEEYHGVEVVKMEAKTEEEPDLIAVENMIAKDEEDSHGVKVGKTTAKEGEEYDVIEFGKKKAKNEECDVIQVEQTKVKDEIQSDVLEVEEDSASAEVWVDGGGSVGDIVNEQQHHEEQQQQQETKPPPDTKVTKDKDEKQADVVEDEEKTTTDHQADGVRFSTTDMQYEEDSGSRSNADTAEEVADDCESSAGFTPAGTQQVDFLKLQEALTSIPVMIALMKDDVTEIKMNLPPKRKSSTKQFSAMDEAVLTPTSDMSLRNSHTIMAKSHQGSTKDENKGAADDKNDDNGVSKTTAAPSDEAMLTAADREAPAIDELEEIEANINEMQSSFHQMKIELDNMQLHADKIDTVGRGGMEDTLATSGQVAKIPDVVEISRHHGSDEETMKTMMVSSRGVTHHKENFLKMQESIAGMTSKITAVQVQLMRLKAEFCDPKATAVIEEQTESAQGVELMSPSDLHAEGLPSRRPKIEAAIELKEGKAAEPNSSKETVMAALVTTEPGACKEDAVEIKTTLRTDSYKEDQEDEEEEEENKTKAETLKGDRDVTTVREKNTAYAQLEVTLDALRQEAKDKGCDPAIVAQPPRCCSALVKITATMSHRSLDNAKTNAGTSSIVTEVNVALTQLGVSTTSVDVHHGHNDAAQSAMTSVDLCSAKISVRSGGGGGDTDFDPGSAQGDGPRVVEELKFSETNVDDLELMSEKFLEMNANEDIVGVLVFDNEEEEEQVGKDMKEKIAEVVEEEKVVEEKMAEEVEKEVAEEEVAKKVAEVVEENLEEEKMEVTEEDMVNKEVVTEKEKAENEEEMVAVEKVAETEEVVAEEVAEVVDKDKVEGKMLEKEVVEKDVAEENKVEKKEVGAEGEKVENKEVVAEEKVAEEEEVVAKEEEGEEKEEEVVVKKKVMEEVEVVMQKNRLVKYVEGNQQEDLEAEQKKEREEKTEDQEVKEET
uniref:Centrosome-associated protein CEP250-like n=1 Tax=Petromyzon marinus TaxID=7757 RepID=A0AAJ7U826_PETMA|nr:centrosome-associated protein CEP250-like [Petromyzon marinus]